MAVVAAGLALALGCERGGTIEGGDTSEWDTDMWISQLQRPDPVLRIRAADNLAKSPQAELQKAVPALRKALSQERHPQAKAAIRKALQGAGSSGG